MTTSSLPGGARVVVVTGAGSGIGRATAVAFAHAGDQVVVADYDARAADAVVAELRAEGAEAMAVAADIGDADQVRSLVDRTLVAYGRLDVLVNNAAVGTAGDVLETSVADLDRTLRTNVVGTFLCCQAALPAMIEAGTGVIVNVASAVAFAAVERRAAYTASKGAIVALTRSIAVDFMAKGIRCNAVAPGTVDSPWVSRMVADQPDPPAAREAMIARQPLGRLGTPEEIADAIMYLASPGAGFAHGTCLVIDGGFTAR